ncbi:MAG: TetR/AcrR family transcriptional regulator [Oscillospiraceae bacterium]|nr:TetR/AcrR family transcriptional regulator [Oscillospiraceae bacterium]
MPKIIENIRDTALEETRKVLESEGYDSLAMRDIAARCGIAVGTLYNYFESKEFLTACVVLEDWQECSGRMNEEVFSAGSAMEGMRKIYSLMGEFVHNHRYLMSMDRRKMSGRYGYEERHSLLMQEMTLLLDMLFERHGLTIDPSVKTVTAELILNMNEKNYDYTQAEPALELLLGQQ